MTVTGSRGSLDAEDERVAGYARDLEKNPFVLPSDEEVFKLRDEERKRKALERERQQDLKIWQKTSKLNDPDSISRNIRLQQLLYGGGAPGGQGDMSSGGSRATGVLKKTSMTMGLGVSGAGGDAGMTMAGGPLGRTTRAGQEKENMADFIAKKREMFLVQMSLDTKREEIRKLEEKAQMKEEALAKSEQMLEEDAVRFDTFLKENDKKAHEAIKRAEKETKLKQDKVQEIKKLTQQIQMIQSEMGKHKESLEECLKYKDFLDRLTPMEWFDQQRQLKKDRQARRRQARMDAKRQAWEDEKRRITLDFERKEKAEEEALAKLGRVKKKDKAKKEGKGEAATLVPDKLLPPMPNLEAEPLTSSGEDLPMHFSHPQQLLDIFQTLEEQNLFLIQNSQKTEQALEELKADYRETKDKLDAKTLSLKHNIYELEQQIAAEEAKAEQLKKRISSSAGDAQLRQERLLKALNEKVVEVYKQCGFDATLKPNTLFMLSELEAKLEDLLSALDQMPEDYVIKAEKEKEKRRREKKRQEQQELQLKMQEERNRKALERSMQAPKKRTGRQVMFRSQPVRKAIREEKEEVDQDALDENKYLR